MALSADRITKYRNPGRLVAFEVKASTTIYGGGLVCVDLSTGKAEPATSAAGKVFVGVAKANAAAAASGTTYVDVWTEGEFLLAKTSAAVTDVGNVFAVSDDLTVVPALGTVTINPGGTNDALVWTALAPYEGIHSEAITITYKDPGAASQTIAVDVYGYGIVVTLATDSSSDITSTGDTIKTAVAAHTLAAAMVSVADLAANDGSGVVTAMDSVRLAIGPLVGTCVGYDGTTQLWINIGSKVAAAL